MDSVPKPTDESKLKLLSFKIVTTCNYTSGLKSLDAKC
jgi:hypothetical protein